MALLATVAATVFAVGVASAGAKTYEVTRHDDPVPGPCKANDCSVREAIRAANSHPGRDKVVLPDRKPRYELERANAAVQGEDENLAGDLDVTGALTLAHPGKGMATIDANEIDRVLDVHPDAATTLSRIKLTGGGEVSAVPPRPAPRTVLEQGEGGGVQALSALKLLRSAVVGNESGGGGGIAAYARLIIRDSLVSRNSTVDAVAGGISGAGKTTIVRSRVLRNEAGNAGGGVEQYPGSIRIVKSTIAGNRAPAGVGGLYLYEAEGFVSQSTISGNRAGSDSGGVSVSANSDLTMVNSTVTGNRATADGGGIYVSSGSGLTLRSVTIARNTADSDDNGGLGGGIALSFADDASLVNSIVALNKAGTIPNDCEGAFSSDGGNLLGVTAGCTGFSEPADLIGDNPKLGPLKGNGGPTKTLALRNGSAAIGEAVKAVAPARDQRGVKRDNNPDIGAFER
jgi:hypothetical protein